MEAKYIIVSIVKSNNSENNVWAVAITGEEQPQGYCKSAYKAMRFAFLLKKQTGINIDDKSLKSLSQQIAEIKAQKAEAEAKAGQEKIAEVAEEFIESHSVDAVLAQQPEQEEKPKKQRKPRTKKVAQPAAATAELIAFV